MNDIVTRIWKNCMLFTAALEDPGKASQFSSLTPYCGKTLSESSYFVLYFKLRCVTFLCFVLYLKYIFFPFTQKNEIDLDALLLMSEKDYADIGLPKVRDPCFLYILCVKTIVSIWSEMSFLSADIICSDEKRTFFPRA